MTDAKRAPQPCLQGLAKFCGGRWPLAVVVLVTAATAACPAIGQVATDAPEAAALSGLVAEIADRHDDRDLASDVLKWESDIAAFERRDAAEPDPDDAVLFLGSSSIRRWETMAEDMRPWPTVRRGYGGSSYLDLLHYAPRLIAAHDPRAVVLFCGNDIKGAATDRTPEEMAALVEEVVRIVRDDDPNREVFVIEVTPTPQRFAIWPQLSAANDRIAAFCRRTPHTHFIGTRDIYLTKDGQPDPSLFGDDDLHQNDDGYARWAERIKRSLLAVLGSAQRKTPQ